MKHHSFRRCDRSLAMTGLLAVAGMLILAVPGWALEPINKTLFTGVAIRGYDPVAYFKEGHPVKGEKTFSYKWNNATWQFASAENKDLFTANPGKYSPQYGGYCAWAVSQNSTADIDPEMWTIVDGKLYLNYSKKVQDKWAQDIPGNIQKGDKNWPDLVKKK